MKNRRLSPGWKLAVWILVAGLPLFGWAAPEDGVAEKSGPQEIQAEQKETIHRILEQSEEVLTGRGFSYDPAGRRDPFRSLLRGLTDDHRGPRPKGIAGMMINEVNLVGIVTDRKRPIAFFNGTDNRGYFMHEGESLYDGKIIRINSDSGFVLFQQEVDDPRSIKPYREVTKRLKPVKEEGL